MRVLVVGASGNLGSHFAASLLEGGHIVRLTFRATPLAARLERHVRAEPFSLDLDDPAAVGRAVLDVDVVVYCAGKLFAPNPERFLQRTNYEWVRTAVDAAIAAKVRKFVLLSFPHVEEGTTPDRPGLGSQEVQPKAIHARTRLLAERHLVAACKAATMTPVILRVGVVYGAGVKIVEAASKLLRWHLLAIWRQPTWVHLITLKDAVRAVVAAVEIAECSGVYNVCDEQPVLLQAFLDKLAGAFGYPPPLRLPAWCFWLIAWLCQTGARVLGTAAPVNLDIMRMGMTSAVADTTRFRRELLHDLVCPTLDDGLRELRASRFHA